MTDQRPRTALVAGASGLVGGELLELLLADPIVGRVHSLVRRPSGRTDPALAEQIVDFAQLSAAALPPRADEAYCCLGTTMRAAGSREAFRRVDHDYVVAFGKLALALGARSLAVVSSVGADPAARSFYLRVKGEMEHELRSLGLPSLVILRPSLLLGERREARLGERAGELGLRLASPLLKGSLARYRPVHAHTVALAAVAAGRGAAPGVLILEHAELERWAATPAG
jgi:uncharacterized protein YbjT (DUF2867 family)